MTDDDLTDLLRRAPRPVRRLAERLRLSRTPLASAEIADATPGDRLYLAATDIGTVSVWRRERVWGVALAPAGTSLYVDAGVWAACQDGRRLGWGAPPIGRQVEWLEGLLDAGVLPPYDPACLEARIADRQRQGEPVTGLRLVLVLIAAAVFFVGTAWASVAFDQPGLRIVAASGLAGILVALISPYARRRQQRRAARRR